MYAQKLNTCALILAAGMSTRMNNYKPLLPLRGKTLIENTVDSALAGGAGTVLVVTGYRGAELEALLHWWYAERVTFVRNENYAQTDMMESIQIGCRSLPACDAFFLLPGDMPMVRPSTFQKLLDARPAEGISVVFPTLDGRRKHPPLVDAQLIPEILAFHEDGGLRQLWHRHEDIIHMVPVDDEGVWIDLDTPDDYQLCRQTYEFKIGRL